MKHIVLSFSLIFGLPTFLWAGLIQTDTHTYIISGYDNAVLAINRQTGQETRINVGKFPTSMVIHGGVGYVLHNVMDDDGLSVIDLNINAVTKTIRVGNFPRSMVIHGEVGYVVNWGSDTVAVIDLQANTVTRTIPVDNSPLSMVIYGEVGYVVRQSGNVTVLDLKSETVTQTIPVGYNPTSMVIHGGVGYVLHDGISDDGISVIDLNINAVTKTIRTGRWPRSIVIHGGMGYVVHEGLDDVEAIDLKTNLVVTTFENPRNKHINFSDTHIYFGRKKVRPHYPTLARINLAKAEKTLGEFVAMMPEVFKLGEIDKRSFPKEENVFDTVPSYALAQEIFWDLKTGEPLMDPEDILATLITMKYPQKFLQNEAGAWLRKRLQMAFFQTVWVGDKDKAKVMLKYFVQLQDPVITKLATYTFKAVKESSDQQATNSTRVH